MNTAGFRQQDPLMQAVASRVQGSHVIRSWAQPCSCMATRPSLAPWEAREAREGSVLGLFRGGYPPNSGGARASGTGSYSTVAPGSVVPSRLLTGCPPLQVSPVSRYDENEHAPPGASANPGSLIPPGTYLSPPVWSRSSFSWSSPSASTTHRRRRAVC